VKVYYDPKHDVVYIEFSDRNVVDTIEVEDGILIDYGENKEIVGIEIIDASRRLKADLQEITIKLERL